MGNYSVRVYDIRPGNTIVEDIYINTRFPIIRKSTVVTTAHIEVLRAFCVKQVKIEEDIIKKVEMIADENNEMINAEELLAELELEKTNVEEEYNKAVREYKKEFAGWQAGIKLNIVSVRSIILPILEIFSKKKEMLTLLDDYSNSKDYLYHHPIAVGILASAISKEMGFPTGQILQLGIAGVLADCGMAKVDASIMEKAAFLTKQEFNEVKKHPIHSYQMVQDTSLIRQEMKLAILQHHERLDGSGYPRGDKLEKITLFAQVLAVADVYHAMTSERMYRSKESPFKVIEMLLEEEFGRFDIKVVQALSNLVGRLSIGTTVKLTNGKTGIVLFVQRDAPLRPMIKMDEDASVLDLAINRDLAVERVLA